MSLTTIKENYKRSGKKINAIIGDIIIAVVASLLFGLNGNLNWIAIGVLIVFSIKPYLFSYINIIFKGEVEEMKKHSSEEIADKTEKIAVMREKLGYLREISEYRIQLAYYRGKNGEKEAIIANKDWSESNNGINETHNKNN